MGNAVVMMEDGTSKAMKLFRKAQQLDPKQPEAYNNMGLLLARSPPLPLFGFRCSLIRNLLGINISSLALTRLDTKHWICSSRH